MQIFAYLKSAEISDEDLQAVRDAGLIPIAVDHFDEIQIIEPIPKADQNPMLGAALAAIQAHGGTCYNSFGKAVARFLMRGQNEQE